MIFDELLRRHSRDELPLYYAYAATDGAFWAWVFGDDEGFARYLSLLEDALTPGLEAGFVRMIEAAHGRAITGDDKYAWPVHVAIAQLYRLGHAPDRAEAVSGARAAALAAEERADPMLQVLAHTASYVLDETARPAQAAALSAIAQRSVHRLGQPRRHPADECAHVDLVKVPGAHLLRCAVGVQRPAAFHDHVHAAVLFL